MKTSKILLLLVMISSCYLITNCSNDETIQNVSKNAKVDKYLKSFYATNYQLGKAVETKQLNNSLPTSTLNRTVEVEDVMITEVFVGDDTRARGYIITNKSTGDLIYFIDVDRIDFKLTSVKIDVNDTKVFDNIDEFEKYTSTNQLDYIKIAEEYNSNPEFAERKFWGSSYSQGPCNQTTGLAQLFEDYHVMGIRTKHEAAVDVVTHGPIFEPCGMH